MKVLLQMKNMNYDGIVQQQLARRNTITKIQREQKLPRNKFGQLLATLQVDNQQRLKKANTSKKIQQSSLIKGHYNKRQTPTI